MRNKKRYLLIAVVICIVLGMISAVFLIRRNAATGDNTVTCYEWLEMLGKQVGMEEPYVSSAVEWNVLDNNSDFEAKKDALGAFIALTAMKTVGESKLQIYLDTKEPITDDIYIALAIEHGLIEEERLSQKFSKEECKQVLETLKGVQFGVFWRDDYEKVIYQDNVVELPSAEVLHSNADGSEIVVSNELRDSLELGTVIVYEQERTGLKFAREVSSVGSDGTLSLNSVELDQAVETLMVSDIREVTFEDIINYYGFEETTGTVNNAEYRQIDVNIINTAVFSQDMKSKGFKISVSTEDEDEKRHLEVKVTDNTTNVSYTLPISFPVKAQEDYEVEVDVDKIYVGGQADYSVLGGLKYAEAAVDAHATFTGKIKAEVEKQIPLFKTPVPLGGGVVGVDIQILMVLSLEGEVSFEADLPVEASVAYEKGKGVKNFKHDCSFQNPKIEADCTVGAAVRFEPTLIVLECVKVVDVEVDVGVEAEAQAVFRPNRQMCVELAVSFPILTVSVCEDDTADTILGDLGVSAEWEIISSDNAPLKKGLHYEKFPGETGQVVAECTYEKEESIVSDETSEFAKYSTYELPIELWVHGPIKDAGDYYTIKGHLGINYGIGYEEFEHLDEGDHFTILDMQFIKGDGFSKEGFPELIYPVSCIDDAREYYICTTVSKDFGRSIDRPYYYLYDSISDYDDSVRLMECICDEWDVLELKIAKDALISSLIQPEQSYTAEECLMNNIFLDDYYSIATYSTVNRDIDEEEFMFFNIIFDENGIVDSMILYSDGLMPD